MSNNGLSHLISVPTPPPPVEDLTFLLSPEDWLKLHSPLKNWVISVKNMGLPLKNFVKIKASLPKNSIFFYSTPKEILNFYNLPLKNSMVPQPGGGGGGGVDIKCNSPMQIINKEMRTAG